MRTEIRERQRFARAARLRCAERASGEPDAERLLRATPGQGARRAAPSARQQPQQAAQREERELCSSRSASIIDLLISDIGMPSQDGYAPNREIRRREGYGRRMPVIALTSYARSQDRDQAF